MEKQPLKVRVGVYLLVLLAVVILLGKLQVIGKLVKSQTFSFSFINSGLSEIVNSELADAQGNYAVYVENLVSGEKYGFHEQDIFPAASLYKIYLVAAVVELAEQGKISLTDNISTSLDHLVKRYGGVDFGYEDAPDEISYSVDEALRRVGRISDNFAALMLGDKIGWDKIQNMADRIGAQNTSIKDPISTTAFDIGLYFKKLYQGEIISKEASQKIIDYISLNQLNNRIPAGVPVGVKVVHKTGELPSVRNDAGIVFLRGRSLDGASPSAGTTSSDYIIVLLAKDVDFEDDAVKLEADISQKVYQYFLSRK
ncbi:MAG: serine hydrolase [Candidatus Daviesbacteria bacterium]|nr:serine hydrolase [Candidatus Daviesbacteria bacterium]